MKRKLWMQVTLKVEILEKKETVNLKLDLWYYRPIYVVGHIQIYLKSTLILTGFFIQMRVMSGFTFCDPVVTSQSSKQTCKDNWIYIYPWWWWWCCLEINQVDLYNQIHCGSEVEWLRYLLADISISYNSAKQLVNNGDIL